MVMNALLEDLKDQVRDQLSWRKSICVVTRSQKQFVAHNQYNESTTLSSSKI